MLIAIDPGTSCGYATSDGTIGSVPLWREPRNGRQARKASFFLTGERKGTLRKPGIAAEPAVDDGPRWTRAGRIYDLLERLAEGLAGEMITVICEAPPPFMSPKMRKSLEILDNMRGAVMAWCFHANARLELINPIDLKRFATGKGVADKVEMVAAARAKLGYAGDDDNEADALWLLAWAREHVHTAIGVSGSSGK